MREVTTAPDLRDITLRLDDLYGASVGELVRKSGDYQTTGLICGFIAVGVITGIIGSSASLRKYLKS